MTVGSLFAGIGGFELAAQWAGFEPIWSNEIDPFCCQVLRKNFKHRIIEDDIRNIGKHNLEPVDILTGGFPCQPFSIAGSRKGKDDPRYLWPENYRIIREIKPAFYIGENVGASFNLVDQVAIDLENEGYKVEPFSLPAISLGFDHVRERIWFIAYSIGSGYKRGRAIRENQKYATHGNILETQARYSTNYKNEIESMFRGESNGLPNRMDRVKSLGNAIVPQIALEIFKAIKEVENLTP